MPSMAWTPIGVRPPHGVSSRLRAPRVRLQHQRIGKRHRRFDVQDGAEVAGADPLAQLGHLRMEAAVVAEAERDAGLRRRGDGLLARPPCVSANGFSQKTCLPAARAAITCAGVQRVRRRQHDGVDVRVGEQRLVAVGEPSASAPRRTPVTSGGHRARGARHEADHVARALHRLDERLAPPAEAHHGCADHVYLASEAARTSDPRPSDSATGRPSSLRTMLVPCTSDTIL